MKKKKRTHPKEVFVATKIREELHKGLWDIAKKVSTSSRPELNDGVAYALKAAREKYEQEHASSA